MFRGILYELFAEVLGLTVDGACEDKQEYDVL